MTRIPRSVDEIDAHWLSQVLGSPCQECRLTLPKERRGFGSEIVFLELTGSDVPATMVLKLMPEHAETRELVRTIGSFAREARFYESLAEHCSVRTPAVYGAGYDSATGDGFLLLEDCSSMSTFDFLSPPEDLDLVKTMVGMMARFHADWWGQTDQLTGYIEINQPQSQQWQAGAELVSEGWARWLESDYTRFAPHGALPICERIARQIRKLMTDGWPKDDLTMAHMDFHLQNVFHDPDRLDDPMVLFDFDSLHVGRGAHDLAYFLSVFPTEFRREHEQALLAHYLKAVAAAGVDYDMPRLRDHYRFGSLFNTFLVPVTLELDMSTPEGQELVGRITNQMLQTMLDQQAYLLLDDDH